MEDYRVSKWTFETSAGVGLGLGAFAMSGGMIALRDPHSHSHQFHYGGFGIGFSQGFSLTKIEIPSAAIQNYVPGGSGSFDSFPSTGTVFMTKAFKGRELARSDICGVAAYVELSGNLIAGYGATLMFLNINQLLTLANVAAPQFHLLESAIAQAPAILFMRGSSMGPQAGMGLNSMLGMLN